MSPRPPLLDSKKHRDFSFSAVEAGLEERFLAMPKAEWKKILDEPHENIKAPGKATKLTEKIAQEVWGAIRMGMTIDRAAQAAGVHRVTMSRWFRAGKGTEKEPPREPYASFLAACIMADAICERDCLNIIRSAANGETKSEKGTYRVWTAAAWILERRYGYGKPKETEAPEATAAAAGGTSLADVVGASAAVAANMSDAPPVDPEERIRELEAMVAEMRAEVAAARKALNAEVSAPESSVAPPNSSEPEPSAE